MNHKFKNVLLVIIGCTSLFIGAIGIFVPVLPTTPLVILAAACFSSSSEKLYKVLIKSKYFGSYIDNYKNKTGVSKEAKRNALIFLWVTLTASMIINRDLKIVIILLVVGVGVTIHITKLKNRER